MTIKKRLSKKQMFFNKINPTKDNDVYGSIKLSFKKNDELNCRWQAVRLEIPCSAGGTPKFIWPLFSRRRHGDAIHRLSSIVPRPSSVVLRPLSGVYPEQRRRAEESIKNDIAKQSPQLKTQN